MISVTVQIRKKLTATAKFRNIIVVIGGSEVTKEIPLTGDIDGSNKDFVLANDCEDDSFLLFWQGQKLVEDDLTNGFTKSGLNITVTEAPETGDALEAYGAYD